MKANAKNKNKTTHATACMIARTIAREVMIGSIMCYFLPRLYLFLVDSHPPHLSFIRAPPIYPTPITSTGLDQPLLAPIPSHQIRLTTHLQLFFFTTSTANTADCPRPIIVCEHTNYRYVLSGVRVCVYFSLTPLIALSHYLSFIPL